MTLIIDGYNLLNVVGFDGGGRGHRSFERARLALLNFLAESLDAKVAASTTVVFDAANAPPGLPRKLVHRGISVCFAADYDDADTLIEEMIEEDTVPRRLVVVSSDHRLHRAARRRRAKAIDSDRWYSAIVRARQKRRSSSKAAPAKPPVPLSQADVAYWLRQFGESSISPDPCEGNERETSDHSPTSGAFGSRRPLRDNKDRDKTDIDKLLEADDIYSENPFPPGYAEDLELDE